MAEIPAGLMAFIKQSPMAMPSIASLIPKSAGRRADPTVAQRAKQAYEQQQAEQAAAMFKDIAGQQGMAEQDMGPPTAQGEMSIEPATQGTGLYSNDPQRFTTAASEMIQSGNPMLQKQGMDMMDKIQAGAATSKQTNLMKNYQSYLGMLPEGEKAVPFNEFRRTGTTINIGGEGGGNRFMTDEEKDSQGIPPERSIWLGKDNKPTVINKEKYTQAQLDKAAFARRMESGDIDVEDVVKNTGFDPTSATYTIARNAGPLGNKAMSPEGQLYQQGAINWLTANLRDESGAVISPDEAAQEYYKWFPVYGDKPAVIAQKKKRRAEVVKGMAEASGGAYKLKSKTEGLPEGTKDIGDGKFLLPNGITIEKE